MIESRKLDCLSCVKVYDFIGRKDENEAVNIPCNNRNDSPAQFRSQLPFAGYWRREQEQFMENTQDKLIFDIGKVESIMKAIEATYLDLFKELEDAKAADNATYAFYALWDSIKRVEDDLGIK